MDRKPVIGITGRRRPASEMGTATKALDGLEVDVHFVAYSHEVIRAGGIPVQLPMQSDPADVISIVDGLLISGGADIEPGRYGAEREALTNTEPTRDDFEFGLIAAAEAAALPLLGICRGFQVVNVHAGGTLHQHVQTHARWNDDPTAHADVVSVTPGTVAHELYGDSVPVNSLHHQTVDAVGAGLVVAGTAADGTVELLEGIDTPVLALQWHPEMMQLGDVDPAFVWLVERATEYRANQHRPGPS